MTASAQEGTGTGGPLGSSAYGGPEGTGNMAGQRKCLIKGSTLVEWGQQAALCTVITHFRRNQKLELTGRAKAGLRSQPPAVAYFPVPETPFPAPFCLLLGFIVTSGS